MFKVDTRSRSYCVSTYPHILENEFGPSFLHNLVVANESSQAAMASRKQSHGAIRRNTHPISQATFKALCYGCPVHFLIIALNCASLIILYGTWLKQINFS